MARWWKSRKSLAALLILTGTEGCGMTETSAEARTAPNGAAVFDVVARFLAGGDPVALIRARGARIDESFAANGAYPFEAAQIAARGSSLAVPNEGVGGPTTLKLVLPGETTLRMADVSARLGQGKRLPALPGKTWQYAFAGDGGRVVVVLTADPANSASRVTHVTAIRQG